MGASHSRESDLGDEEEDEGGDVFACRLRSLSLGGDDHDPDEDEEGEDWSTGQVAKLYRHVGGGTPKARWLTADKLVKWKFSRRSDKDKWYLRVGKWVHTMVDEQLQIRLTDAQLRVDMVCRGVWAMKFFSRDEYKAFVDEYQSCLFENTYGLEWGEESRIKVFGKDFMAWLRPEEGDESIWEDAPEELCGVGGAAGAGDVEDEAEQQEELKQQRTPSRATGSLSEVKETLSQAVQGGIQSVTMGGGDNSFLVSGSGFVEVFKNTPTGLYKRDSLASSSSRTATGTPKKGILIRGESQMMVMSPSKSSVVRQLDLESGKTVAEWKFEKDSAAVLMKDIVNDAKGAQLDTATSTFLGLDDNHLCRWDTRLKRGAVGADTDSPVLDWTQGHQFSRGTNFQCLAATGDGCIVVGSKDGKVRLYGRTSLRQAKTSFPGLGSATTSIDVTYDGKWVLATTDTYLMVISTVFKDKSGTVKTGFTGRMGNRIAAPRLLKLTPLDAHLAGRDQKFHGGQFSWVTEGGKQENHLVVSLGKYSIVWDFKRVKDSKHDCYTNSDGLKCCYCYTVVPKEESVVESRFMHDKFNAGATPLIVATPKKLSSFNV